MKYVNRFENDLNQFEENQDNVGNSRILRMTSELQWTGKAPEDWRKRVHGDFENIKRLI